MSANRSKVDALVKYIAEQSVLSAQISNRIVEIHMHPLDIIMLTKEFLDIIGNDIYGGHLLGTPVIPDCAVARGMPKLCHHGDSCK